MKTISKVLSLTILVLLESMVLMSQGAEANTIVQFEMMGIYGPDGPTSSFQVELFDTQTPVTVTNFLRYVNDHSYDNSIVHRNVKDFVVQGGGYKLAGANSEASPNPAPISPLVQYPPIQNEPGISNVRGTIAMARAEPGSATSQWYFNVSDNTFLDDNDGGWTAFGRVLDSGMSVLDQINNSGTYRVANSYTWGDGVPLFRDNGNTLFYITVASIHVVPEPSTLTLLCMCSVGVLAYVWRRRKLG